MTRSYTASPSQVPPWSVAGQLTFYWMTIIRTLLEHDIIESPDLIIIPRTSLTNILDLIKICNIHVNVFSVRQIHPKSSSTVKIILCNLQFDTSRAISFGTVYLDVQ